MILYAYKQASSSAKLLAEALNIKRISHKGSSFKGRARKTVLNWGATTVPEEVRLCRLMNPPEKVELACDKLKFFTALTETNVRIPEFYTSFEEVLKQIKDGADIVARSVLNGHSGAGITLITQETPLKNVVFDAPLYTQYIKKKDEYRVHIVDNEVVDVQRKAVREDKDKDEVNWQIRNHDNGFIYARENLEVPEDVLNQAILAVAACDLDFAAVDVVWNDHQNKAYVLEVNTAPGLEGQTVEKYADAIRRSF